MAIAQKRLKRVKFWCISLVEELSACISLLLDILFYTLVKTLLNGSGHSILKVVISAGIYNLIIHYE
jgi:hypothetical protein